MNLKEMISNYGAENLVAMGKGFSPVINISINKKEADLKMIQDRMDSGLFSLYVKLESVK